MDTSRTIVRNIRDRKRYGERGVYIGRPSIWGNPFKIGPDGTREEVIAKYELYIRRTPELMARIVELRGKVLLCHCYPLPCHGDVLVRLAGEVEK